MLPAGDSCVAGGPIYRKRRLLDALYFDTRESGSSLKVVINKATVNAHGYVISGYAVSIADLHTAWASALLVLTTKQCQSYRVWDE